MSGEGTVMKESQNQLFLQALKASLTDSKVTWDMEIQPSDWQALFQLAKIHKVIPMIFEAVYACPAAKKLDPAILRAYRGATMQQVMQQTIKTEEFLQLNRALQEAGITPLVVKGIICRNLYPQPDHRASGDEDILIPEEQFTTCHEAMLNFGMALLEPGKDIYREYEVPYGKQNSPLYIELHKNLFPPESDAYGELNQFFEGVFDRAVCETIQGIPVYTLEYTDHLFYLICHAFKHFLHSGFGIRQVCDIVMFANAYGTKIDWNLMLKQCRKIRADVFTAALFRIGRNYLNFDPEKACYPAEWQQIEVDETAMLEDLLSSGIYGASDMSRKHSSNITLNAVSAQKQGKKGGSSVLKTIFPSAGKMKGRYPYLEKRPYLLPMAWADRILKYQKETSFEADNNAADSIKIGNQRIELMKKYGIIK